MGEGAIPLGLVAPLKQHATDEKPPLSADQRLAYDVCAEVGRAELGRAGQLVRVRGWIIGVERNVHHQAE